MLPRLLQEIGGSLLSVIFPASCSLCGEELTEPALAGICAPCWEALEPWRGPICTACGLPLASTQVLDATTTLCGACRTGEFRLDRARSFSFYSGPLRAAILQLKFRRRERLGKRLGGLLVQVWEGIATELGDDTVVLVPVPLHISRQRERGFNQAELLADGLRAGLAKSRGGRVPDIDTRSLRKTRATPPQTGLSLSARRENVRGAFAVARPERIRHKKIVLVDDVMTTGATLSSCARALESAGAQAICALTLARATPEFPDLAPSVDDSGLGPS
ncbi:MAG: ComF family protein [Acidobacteriia bacterium]|nr:ComF family protein [Terriglobia bacterium]